MCQNLAAISCNVLTVSADDPLTSKDKKGAMLAWRCQQLEALVSQFGFSDQEKDEIHQINGALQKRRIPFVF